MYVNKLKIYIWCSRRIVVDVSIISCFVLLTEIQLGTRYTDPENIFVVRNHRLYTLFLEYKETIV